MFSGAALTEFDEVEETEVVLGAGTRRAAAAAIGECEGAQGHAVLGKFVGHRELRMMEMDLGGPRGRKDRGAHISTGKSMA